MSFFTALLYVALAGIPPVIWIWYFNREDIHPEPKRDIVKSFALGAVLAPLALLIENALPFSASPFLIKTFGQFLLIGVGVAFIEELTKYTSARIATFRNKDFSEPEDAMIYMITAALGFAFVENLFSILPISAHSIPNALAVITVRFFTANLLHALSAGVVGYFWGISYRERHRWIVIAEGIVAASFLHGLYNYIIMSIVSGAYAATAWFLIGLAALLGVMLVLIYFGFKELSTQHFTPRSTPQHLNN